MPLLTALLLALVGVALLTSGAWSRGTQPPSDNAAAGGNVVTTGSSSTAKQQKAAARWAGVPAVSLSKQVPSWAGCPPIPCDYGEMVDGPADTTVSRQAELQLLLLMVPLRAAVGIAAFWGCSVAAAIALPPLSTPPGPHYMPFNTPSRLRLHTRLCVVYGACRSPHNLARTTGWSGGQWQLR